VNSIDFCSKADISALWNKSSHYQERQKLSLVATVVSVDYSHGR